MKYKNTRTGTIIDVNCDCMGKYWKKLEETSAFSSIPDKSEEKPVEEKLVEEVKTETVIEPVKTETKTAKKASAGAIINPKKGKKG